MIARGNDNRVGNPMYRNVQNRDEEEEVNGNSTYSGENSPSRSPVRKRSIYSKFYQIYPIILAGLGILMVIQQSKILYQSNTATTNCKNVLEPVWLNNPLATSVLSLHEDRQTGHIFGQIPLEYILNEESFILVEQITSGIGLQSLFWDPGNVISQPLCRFKFSNDKSSIIFYSPNSLFRSDNKELIQRSFSNAIIWSGKVLYQDAFSVWVDFHELFHMIPGGLADKTLLESISSFYGAGSQYSVDISRSFAEIAELHPSSMLSSVAVDFHATLVWSNPSSSPPLDFQTNFPVSQIISTTVRRTLHRLGSANDNDNGFRTREYHPKSGLNYLSYMNEDASILQNRQKLLIVRHHLPRTIRSAAVTPNQQIFSHGILYLVDPLIPEPYRSAVLEGVRWWDDAFRSAGYPNNTFDAYIAPKTFDPYDLFRSFSLTELDESTNLQNQTLGRIVYKRVHFVQWIDRDLRSYSVGLRVIDPRTGEILRGHVRLEGLRLRQDALIAEALLSPYSLHGSISKPGLEDAIMRMVLQRVKHLGAHEVGHSLGLAHNFAGSTYTAADPLTMNNIKSNALFSYASVMDYPPPYINYDAKNRGLILNENSYANGIGIFDKVTIQYAYTQFVNTDNAAAEEWVLLRRLLARAEDTVGYVFVTDQDSSASSADWRDTKWDLSQDKPIYALNRSLEIRKLALQQLGMHSLHNASAVSAIRTLLPIVYFWHRYDLEVVAKLIGGHSVPYALRDDIVFHRQDIISVPVNATVQLQAIDMMIAAMLPETLSLPLVGLMPVTQSTAFGYVPDIGGTADVFASRRGQSQQLDPLLLYQAGMQLVLEMLLEPSRVERLAQQPFVYTSSSPSESLPVLPGLDDVLDRIFSQIFPPLTLQAQVIEDNEELCSYLAKNIGLEYFVLLTSWKAALQSLIDRKSSNAFSFLTIYNLEQAQGAFLKKLQWLETYGTSWTCSVPDLVRSYNVYHPSTSITEREMTKLLKMMSSISSFVSPPSVKLPNGPPI